MGWKDSWDGGSRFALTRTADHPTRTQTLTLTRTLWGDQCLDAVAGEGSRLIRPTWMLCLEKTLGWFGRFGMLWVGKPTYSSSDY